MDLNEEDMDWLMQSSDNIEKVLTDDAAGEMRASEEKQLAVFLKILRSGFGREPLVTGSVAFGVLTCEDDLSALIRKLKALGYFFAIRSSKTKKGSVGKKVLLKGPPLIEVEHPYVVEKLTRFYCSSGRQYNKQVLQNLKTALAEGKVVGEDQFWVWLSLPRMHHHPPSLPGRSLDPEVKAMMHGLMRGQNLTVDQVKLRLRHVVEKEFARGPVRPALDNTAFFPTDKVIYNHLRHEGLTPRRRRRAPDVNTVRAKAIERLQTLQEAVQDCSDVTVLKMTSSLLRQMRELMPQPSQETP